MERGLVLERDRELHGLAELAARVMRGAGGTIVLEGQPGLGKSTLLSEVTRSLAQGAGPRVLSFCCGELEQEFAWGAVRGIVAPPAAPGDLCAGVRAVFAAILRLAEDSPLLVTLDDAQWCDVPSLRALTYLQRRVPALPVGLVVALRPAAGTAQRSLLDGLQAGPGTEAYRLRPLSAAAVTVLVRGRVLADADPAFCDACHELTAGNPFYLHELLTECRERGIDPGRPPTELFALTPPKVLNALLLRLERLTAPGAPPLARAAAVLGDGAPLCRAAALAGVDVAGAAAALDALSAAELLCSGEPLRFVHPLVRTAIYAAIPAAERAAQHARAADLLRAAHARDELVAGHLLRAPLAGDAVTVTGLRAAAARARAQGAPRAAAGYLRRALAEPPRPEDRAGVLHELAGAELAVGDLAAVARLTEALELAPADRRRAAILQDLGRARHHAGRFTAAAGAFERGLAIARSLPDEAVADQLEAGYLMSAALDARRVDDALGRIDAIQRRTDAAPELLARVLFTRTMAGAPHGELVNQAQRLWADGGLLRAAGADSPALWPVIGTLGWCDAYGPALQAVERVLEAAAEQGLALTTAQARLVRASLHHRMGRLDEVPADARAAIEAGQGGADAYLPEAAYRLGLAELERGDGDGATAALGLAGPAERWEGTGMAAFVHALNGELALAAGQGGAALAAFEACGRVMDALRIASPSVMPWRSDAARALLVLGEVGLARGLAEEELRAARACGAPRATGVALRVCGLARGGDAGIALLRESVALQARCGAELERARGEVDLGAAIRRGGRCRSARPYLQAGLERAQATGATVLARRAETELRAAGGRGRRLTDTGPGLLTASERRIAELAAQGYSNRAIAGLLQISVKGVEWHLHQSYRKLDVAGRRQLGPALLGGARDADPARPAAA